MNRLGYGIKQDSYEDYVWHIVDRDSNIVATFENKEEAKEELRVYYS
jgi:hypothetical protein